MKTAVALAVLFCGALAIAQDGAQAAYDRANRLFNAHQPGGATQQVSGVKADRVIEIQEERR